MGDLVKMKWEKSSRQKAFEILAAVRWGSLLLLVIATAIAIVMRWWWMLGSGLAIGSLGSIFVMYAYATIREKDACYPDAFAMKRAYERGLRTCTVEFRDTRAITVGLLRVEQLGRYVELYVHRDGGTRWMYQHLVLDITKWRVVECGEGIVLHRIGCDEPHMSSLTLGLVSLRLTHDA